MGKAHWVQDQVGEAKEVEQVAGLTAFCCTKKEYVDAMTGGKLAAADSCFHEHWMGQRSGL